MHCEVCGSIMSDTEESTCCGTLPAYGLDPSTMVDAPQCSSSGEFCFLCAFEADADENCLYSSIVDLIMHLASQKRELSFIVRAVRDTYNRTIRDTITYKHPDTNAIIAKPAWSMQSIKRHLLFSTQFSELFDQVVRSILHSLVVRHNATIIDADTGDPIEEKRKALCDTLKTLQSWEKHTNIRGGSAHSPQSKRRKT